MEMILGSITILGRFRHQIILGHFLIHKKLSGSKNQIDIGSECVQFLLSFIDIV